MAGGSIGPTSVNVPQHSSDPSGASQGDMYYNTTASTMKVHNGSVWTAIYEEPFTASGGTTSTSGIYTSYIQF